MGTSLRWAVGYRHAVDWLPSTQIDLALMAAMVRGDRAYQDSDEGLVARFAEALKLFDPLAEIATDYGDNMVRRALEETISVTVQSAGRGKRPWTLAAEDLWPLDEVEDELED